MTHPEYRRLQRVVVDGLFRTYDHEIELNLADRVTLLHGPNGVGKTSILGMTNALMMDRLDYFRRIPFSRFLLEFHDGSTLELASGDTTNDTDIKYKLTLNTGDRSRSASVALPPEAGAGNSIVEHQHPSRGISEILIDEHDDAALTAAQGLPRHWDAIFARAGIPDTKGNHPGWLSNFLESANAHLIEAQRLVRTDGGTRVRPMIRPMDGSPPMVSAVAECSTDFQRRLDDTMVRYGRKSQLLDQSFPERLISATDQLTSAELQNKMSALDQKTAALTTIGILDETPTHPSPETGLEGLDDTRLRVMTLYVLDTEKKLSAFDDLARRAETLLENVNRKYRHKSIRLDREHGLIAVSDSGQQLPLASLSSGEQHELVLHYDLLFRVPPNTVVLIDEPELSLHVAWQKRFLPELLEIVKLSDLDALVATHSPFIVGDRSDLMVGLGDPA